MSARDTQRARVYAAESSIPDFWGQTIADDRLQAWVNTALDKQAIRSRWGLLRISVERGRYGGQAYRAIDHFTVGVKGRNPWVMLHEIAHILTPSQYAPHGPEFIGVYTFLVEVVQGVEEARVLRAAFKEAKVRTSRRAIPEVSATVPPSISVRSRTYLAKERKRRHDETALRIVHAIQEGWMSKAEAHRIVDGAQRPPAAARSKQ